MTVWCPAEKLEWYQEMFLSTQLSGIAEIIDSFAGVALGLKNNVFSKNIFQLISQFFLLQPYVMTFYSALNMNILLGSIDCLNILLVSPSL